MSRLAFHSYEKNMKNINQAYLINVISYQQLFNVIWLTKLQYYILLILLYYYLLLISYTFISTYYFKYLYSSILFQNTNLFNILIKLYMLKITPFFPSQTKSKYTLTHPHFSNHFTFINHSSSWISQNKQHQKSFLHFQRLLQLAEPQTKPKKSIPESQTDSDFYNINKKEIQNNKKINFMNNQEFNHVKKLNKQIFKDSINMIKRQQITKCPKIQIKRSTYNNQQKQLNKQNPKSTLSTFRKSTRCETSFRDNLVLKKNRKLKQQKLKAFTQNLKSSDLASIYNNLYNKYEQKPFNELQEAEPLLINLFNVLKKQNEKQEKEKYELKKQRKSFELKQLQFQKTLRKQIKSLTRDTDHILSLEFRDIRDVNNR